MNNSSTPQRDPTGKLPLGTPRQKLKEKEARLRCNTPCKVILEPLDPSKLNNVKNAAHCTPTMAIEFSQELKQVINERNLLTSKTRHRVFEALDQTRSNNAEESRKYKRVNVLLEIVNSEIKYVHQLELIINYFIKPIGEQKLLKDDDFETLFGNINSIYRINKELLEELDAETDNVTAAFLKIAPYLKSYSVYAFDFKKSLDIIQKCRTLNPRFSKFVENQESRPEVQSKLSALLITPIQRVPRYKLLLTQLFELTSPCESDYYHLVGCLEKIKEAAEHINKVVEDQENMQRLIELQRCLRSGEPNIITPGRVLKKEGILKRIEAHKRGPNNKIYVVLMSDIVMFCRMKKAELKVNSLKCFSIFPLNKCKVTEILDKGAFRITCQEEEIVLYSVHLSETKKWITSLNVAIQSYLDDRKTLRKESSSRRPVKRKDMLEYHEVGLSPGRPLKKRKIVDSVSDDSKNGEAYRPLKLLKRRALHSAAPRQVPEEPLQLPQPSCSTSAVLTPTPQNTLAKDLYVFGQRNNVAAPGGFKFGNIFSGVKKLFGFRN